mgnify:CR=1 FL=1
MLSVLTSQRRFCNTTYSIRVHVIGQVCSSDYAMTVGQRLNISIWWSCCRLADDHETQLLACKNYYNQQISENKVRGVIIFEGED